MLVALVILSVAILGAVRLLTMSNDLMNVSKDTEFIGFYNATLLDSVQEQINTDEENINYYVEKNERIGEHTLYSVMTIDKSVTTSNRSIYFVTIETYIGDTDYRKATTRAVLSKFSGSDVYV